MVERSNIFVVFFILLIFFSKLASFPLPDPSHFMNLGKKLEQFLLTLVVGCLGEPHFILPLVPPLVAEYRFILSSHAKKNIEEKVMQRKERDFLTFQVKLFSVM